MNIPLYDFIQMYVFVCQMLSQYLKSFIFRRKSDKVILGEGGRMLSASYYL